MSCEGSIASLVAVLTACCAVGAQSSGSTVTVVQGNLTAPGSTPFHLKAEITDRKEPQLDATVEMFWIDSTHWRREIHSDEFSQKIILNGEKFFEQDTPEYFPLGLQSIVAAMFEPEKILARTGPADEVRTKANGLASGSGVTCFDTTRRVCGSRLGGLDEFVGAAGHSIEFTDYHPFHGKRIARQVDYSFPFGGLMAARVTDLEELKNPNDDVFAIDQPTNPAQGLRVVTLNESALTSLATDKPDIIWPQVLDGNVTGKASFYISIDTSGKVHEVQPLRTDNERSDDSAIRQIKRWKFKPATVEGVPTQVDGILNFDLNTREYGPKEPLNDAQGRKLAASIVDPFVPQGSVPPGTIFKIWVAVDSDGQIIEEIVLDGPSQLFVPCDRALHQWNFRPIMENGQPRPYRTLIEFRF
jgi:Gram-negative bacterial TonB protein C-terminal